MNKLFIATAFAIMSVSVWGQSKLSPYTRHYVTQIKQEQVADAANPARRVLLKKSNERGQVVIPAFVYLQEGYNPDFLTSHGVEVRSVIGQVLTADIPLNALNEVAALDGVKYIEMGTPVQPRLNEARKEAFVNEVQTGKSLPEEYRGKGVVVGVIDNGFDYTHPNFYTRDKSELRIKRVWDQNASGTAPEGFDYGCEYTTAEAILAKGYDTDQTTHGTHVLGIATGADNTNDKEVYGVATDADIVLVSYNSTNMYTGDNTAIIDGIKYIFDYAESVGKPCVINMSLGSTWGPHDGTSTFDRLADELQGPGRLLVGSCGNSGGTKYHASKTFEGNKPDTLATFFNFNYTGAPYGTVEVWCDPGMDITFVPIVYNVSENKVQSYDPARFNDAQCENKTYNFDVNVDGAWGTLSVEGEINPGNGKTHLILSPNYSYAPGYDRGFYLISSNPGTIHLWTDAYTTSLSSFDRPGYIDGDDQSSMDELGGTGKRIISVGAYVTRDHCTKYGVPSYTDEITNALASFSSQGPTPDGRVKPDITAPGTYIISSLSSYYPSSKKIRYSKFTWNNREYDFGYMQGTSMASPFITGVMATWLQAFPSMTPEQAREILQKTARHDSFTGDVTPSNQWGYGKIDAYEGIKESIRIESGVESNRIDNLSHVAIVGDNHVTVLFGYADSHVRIQLYNLQGACVATRDIDRACAGEEVTVDLDDFAAGIYMLRIMGGNTKSMVKKIIVQ